MNASEKNHFLERKREIHHKMVTSPEAGQCALLRLEKALRESQMEQWFFVICQHKILSFPLSGGFLVRKFPLVVATGSKKCKIWIPTHPEEFPPNMHALKKEILLEFCQSPSALSARLRGVAECAVVNSIRPGMRDTKK